MNAAYAPPARCQKHECCRPAIRRRPDCPAHARSPRPRCQSHRARRTPLRCSNDQARARAAKGERPRGSRLRRRHLRPRPAWLRPTAGVTYRGCRGRRDDGRMTSRTCRTTISVVTVDHEPDAPTDRDYQRLLEFRTGLRRFLRWSEQQAAAVGITPAQHQLLLAIRGHAGPEPPTIGEIADTLMLHHHSAVGLVDRAAQAGLVGRRVDRTDHRLVRLHLTVRGARRLDQLSAAHLEELRRLAPSMRSLWANLRTNS